MSRRSCNSGKKSFALGILFGGVVGGITALLFAPKSGDKLRKDLARTYNDASEKAGDLIEEVYEQSMDLVEKAKEIAHDAKEATANFTSKLRKRK